MRRSVTSEAVKLVCIEGYLCKVELKTALPVPLSFTLRQAVGALTLQHGGVEPLNYLLP